MSPHHPTWTDLIFKVTQAGQTLGRGVAKTMLQLLHLDQRIGPEQTTPTPTPSTQLGL